MNIKEALETAGKILKSRNIQTPVREAGVLLAHVIKKDLSYIYAHSEEKLSDELVREFFDVVGKRGSGMPFQYISNRQEFMSLDFYVDQNCLIPRPDTEILVEAALKVIKKYQSPVRILDIGTGSGAIAVSIAYYDKNTVINAIDISENALEIAAANAAKHGVEGRINFINADIRHFTAKKPYAVVVSNPPYIPSGEIENLMPEVAHFEPLIALDGGEDGMDFYRVIASKLESLLTSDGTVLTEVGIGQDSFVMELFEEKGMNVEVLKDLAGINRVVVGCFGKIFP
ncbi:release factor glutamine methyltransferase PrmC [Thermoclostridium stercorarium subsp. stercorarium DSM 8532]|uniref:Release factor glutamine methyltransferase n=1 Tax=Thermoclostridium stercorarium (strain ATCC 35414 / DSM 8532 / NCIMB 11754) TaxID=1121335 RepID=L7VNQ2_THES1|nr:peptide chain release factor N(5)-glutamine methyltransferase [Thermoclostridium stercorarium]AGC67138.1 release factor glutamine methyltransferase PrmC [Thermoclostridium stercorarium subsp. stercorarium DSM 8532]AGI38216.1 protein-glutamine-N5 methyltransferase [Thermoclostridium stercorarium subsp. stercorarium DSM 8532]